MIRSVRKINVAPDKPEEGRPRPFTDFVAYPHLILLGDPGAGKTHLFQETAASEGGRLLKARAFLNMSAESLLGQTLFIDGLDEKRAGRGDQDTIDDLVAKLFAVNPARVRISCRAADWLGESDLAALRPYFEQGGEPPVLLLENLSTDEQREVLEAHGVDRDRAKLCLSEAEERGLGDFLENPQNLIMLWRAVQTGSWPATRRELFELATALMLQESGREQARSGAGTYSVAELRPVAGAICAARLISDVDAISLTEQEGTLDVPGYRSLTFLSPDIAGAALGRRIFEAASEAETVDYAHRTTAEYLAAAFLASQIRDGLPFGRVAALMGVDGHPAPELRGLHAWLAVHLPEYAVQLIDTDPYGVLTYGDAASLSTSDCASLVRALGNLSRTNPWFRSGNWQSHSIGGLARPDMVAEFRAVLGDPDAGFAVRSVVVDALWLGTPLAEMLPDLVAVVERLASPFAERSHAMLALSRLGEAGKDAIRNSFVRLGKASNDLHLRAEVIRLLYGDPFGVNDVVALVNDCLQADQTIGTGMLWHLADELPVGDIPAILDGVDVPQENATGFDRRSWEVGSFFARILVRVWREGTPLDGGRALNWLSKRTAFRGGRGESRARDLREAMRASPESLNAIAEHFLENLAIDGQEWLHLHQFREAILFELSAEALLDKIVASMERADAGGIKQVFLYDAALSFCYQLPGAHGVEKFEQLYERASSSSELIEARGRAVVCKLPDGYFQRRSSRRIPEKDILQKQRQEFDEQVEQIRNGMHVGWITHLGRIYYGLYSDVDRSLSHRDRIAAFLGEERVDSALAGLRAALFRSDLPSFEEVMTLTADHKHYDRWYAFIAGLNERWTIGEGFAEQLTEDRLKALVAFDLANPVFENHDGVERRIDHAWKQALVKTNPALIRDVYAALARLRLKRGEQMADGLRELLTEEPFEPFRQEIVMGFLRDFPNANEFRLGELLDAVAPLLAAHADFLKLADRVLRGDIPVDQRQKDMWLVTAYLLSPSRYEGEVQSGAVVRPGLVFDLRDRTGFASQGHPQQSLPLPMLEFMARITGSLFPQTPHPPDGWSGDTNPWDGTEHFRTLVNMISAVPSEAATNALRRLQGNPDLASYRPEILHALANQQQRRRDAEYDRPNWPQTVKALSNGAPATVADLHALVVAQLRDLKKRIERKNTDIYKQFWNIDSYARPTEPRPEEACRDDLVTLMRPFFLPLGITVEPEGHMVADKRADISVAMPNRKILCELKRDYHNELWTALEGQLERFYAHDPEAKGFGVYCVFWFGAKRPQKMPGPPNGLTPPQSAADLERTLLSLLPEPMKGRLAVIVIDVSGDV